MGLAAAVRTKLRRSAASGSKKGVATTLLIGLVGSTTRPSMLSHMRKRMLGGWCFFAAAAAVVNEPDLGLPRVPSRPVALELANRLPVRLVAALAGRADLVPPVHGYYVGSACVQVAEDVEQRPRAVAQLGGSRFRQVSPAWCQPF